MTAERSRIRKIVHLAAGGLLVLTAGLIDFVTGASFYWGLEQTAVLVIGLLFILMGFLPNFGFVSRLSMNLSLSVLSLFFVFALCEGVFRVVRFDFAREEETWSKDPTYYRRPIVPTGEVYFRRPGPQVWSGQLLNTVLKQRRVEPNPYEDEPQVTAYYNGAGFRNPEDLSDWEIVVTGDSFTELGYLSHEDLFTTILGEELGARVSNLGVSGTGPLSQLSYLRSYGVGPGTRQAVMVFFEGNDLTELAEEAKALHKWEETGERPYRDFKKQTSFTKATLGFLKNLIRPPEQRSHFVDAHYKSAEGDIPVTFSYTPPSGSEVTPESREQFDSVLERYAAFGKEHGIVVWLAYMPCKRRVLHGRVEFVEGVKKKLENWEGSDLPQFVSEMCAAHGIGFIDLTPPLLAESREAEALLYQPIYDTHLDARGSAIVGRELARHLGGGAPGE